MNHRKHEASGDEDPKSIDFPINTTKKFDTNPHQERGDDPTQDEKFNLLFYHKPIVARFGLNLFEHALIAELTMKSNGKTMRLFVDARDKFGEMRFIRENLAGKTHNPLIDVRDN